MQITLHNEISDILTRQRCRTHQLVFVGMNVAAKSRDICEDTVTLSAPQAAAIVELRRRHVHRYRQLKRTLLLLHQLHVFHGPRAVRDRYHILQAPNDAVSTERESGGSFVTGSQRANCSLGSSRTLQLLWQCSLCTSRHVD